MRIDYSEPRQSYVSSPGGPIKHRSSGQSGGTYIIVAIVAGAMLFGSGFGVGWFFSQQSAKKAFRAAMEQQSLENASKEDKKPVVQSVQPVAAPIAGAPTTAPGQPAVAPNQPQAGTPQPATGPGGQPLTFFDNLPKGQKNTVLGSGINEKPKPVPPPAPATTSAAQPGVKPSQQPGAAATKPADTAKPSTSATGYVVQVAAFNSRKDADALKAKLVAKGYAASISETNLNDKGTWHRVRIGRHLDKEAATQIANQLMSGAKVLPDQD